MGDCQNEDLRVSFDSRLKLRFLGSQVTTDAGLLAYRELDEALGLTGMATDVLTDSRQGSNKRPRPAKSADSRRRSSARRSISRRG